MILPLVLILLAFLPAAIVAYGTHPAWGGLAHGVDFILLTRRLQWPLVAVSVVLCVALLVVIISGKRRAWWLIGLMPVLALFVYRFATGAVNQWSIIEEPALASADRATLGDKDYVVGVEFEGNAYAYPYANLFVTPVVLQSDYDKRFILIWSPYANRAVAFAIERELRARELEIVSMPANALLLYNTRLGQFINGVTGQTTREEKPVGFRSPLQTRRTTWARWRKAHPDTKVMMAASMMLGPTTPLPPRYAMAGAASETGGTNIILVFPPPPAQPIALTAAQISKDPLNLVSDGVPVMVFRDPAGELRAFDRRIEGDLSPRFKLNTNAKRAGVALVDSDTDVGWNVNGVAVDGDKARHGKKLAPLLVEDDLYWSVMKFWYPRLQLQR